MSTWGARRVVDLLRSITQIYYRRKYGTLARRMGRNPIQPDDRQGLIVIQIDGLAHDHLLEAVEEGLTPALARMIAEGRFALSPWPCGLPSTTPAVQAGILFGNRYDIPGFRWYEKDTGTAFVAKWPEQMRTVQMRIRQRNRGLLAGGSSYVNMFDGDAELALFTLSALHRQRFFESGRGLSLLFLFFLSPLRVLRVVGLTLTGYLSLLTGLFLAPLRPTALKPYDVVSPFVASAVDATFTEVQTFGVALDIYRRVPVIYANYNAYDAAAHYLGLTHPVSRRALRDIDRRIGQIDRMRTRYRERPYDLYVLSDHGTMASTPFSWQVGHSLGHFILRQLGDSLSLDEMFTREGHARVKTRYLLRELRSVSAGLPRRLRQAADVLANYVDRHTPPDRELEPYDLERRKDVVVRVSGPLAHVYFNVTRRPLNLIELAVLYPQLLDRLLETQGIGLVAGRAGERVVALGPEGGMAVIGRDGLEELGRSPLTPFGAPRRVARELQRVINFPHAGDLVLLGRVGPGDTVVTFEDQMATHGGLGGSQEQAFIATPPGVGLPSIERPEDLYHFFYERYQARDFEANPRAKTASVPENARRLEQGKRSGG